MHSRGVHPLDFIKGLKMKEAYIYYITDDSFDYPSPLGCETKYEINYHGFSINCDENLCYDIKTLEGFGHYSTEISRIKTIEEFIKYLSDTEDEIQDFNKVLYNSDFGILGDFKELINLLKKQIKKSCVKL